MIKFIGKNTILLKKDVKIFFECNNFWEIISENIRKRETENEKEREGKTDRQTDRDK